MCLSKKSKFLGGMNSVFVQAAARASIGLARLAAYAVWAVIYAVADVLVLVIERVTAMRAPRSQNLALALSILTCVCLLNSWDTHNEMASKPSFPPLFVSILQMFYTTYLWCAGLAQLAMAIAGHWHTCLIIVICLVFKP